MGTPPALASSQRTPATHSPCLSETFDTAGEGSTFERGTCRVLDLTAGFLPGTDYNGVFSGVCAIGKGNPEELLDNVMILCRIIPPYQGFVNFA